jgi:hypothetical protein
MALLTCGSAAVAIPPLLEARLLLPGVDLLFNLNPLHWTEILAG